MPELNVVTRCNVPYGYNSGLSGIMSRSEHMTRDVISSLKLVLPNWYVDTNNNTNTWAELGTGSTASVKAAIEYPAGTYTQVLFGGSATGSIASGSNLVSDALSINIPINTEFWCRISFQNTGGVLYRPITANSGIGDRVEVTATDKTTSGTIADSVPNYAYPPAAIISQTNNRSVFMIGTSRTFGYTDTVDGTGNVGEMERSIGPKYAYCNAGISFDSAANLVAAHTKRAALANAYHTDVIVEHGANEGSDDLATRQGHLATIWALFPTLRVYGATLAPYTTSSDSWATVANQTVVWDQITFNDWIRTKPAPLAGVFEISDPVCSSHNSNKWLPGLTGDGLHENSTGTAAIKNSGYVNVDFLLGYGIGRNR